MSNNSDQKPDTFVPCRTCGEQAMFISYGTPVCADHTDDAEWGTAGSL
ncbi:hypothetical protein MAUB1S_01522 [Mycolicibacterium aubagnense]